MSNDSAGDQMESEIKKRKAALETIDSEEFRELIDKSDITMKDLTKVLRDVDRSNSSQSLRITDVFLIDGFIFFEWEGNP